jgi:hypothetical protein
VKPAEAKFHKTPFEPIKLAAVVCLLFQSKQEDWGPARPGHKTGRPESLSEHPGCFDLADLSTENTFTLLECLVFIS